jgi:hypothetical protein
LRYDICGVSFASAEPFPELSLSTSPESKISLRLRREKRITAAGETVRPAANWTLPNGRSFFVSTKTRNGYLLRFDNLADFFIDESGTEVVYAPQPGVPAHSVRHLILDSVIALALSLRGRAVFHASAIVTPFGACAFAAASGVGKSTLAVSFQQAGYQALTDDCLLLDYDGGAVYGLPSYPGARLWEDSLSLLGAQHGATLSVAHYNSKRRYTAGPFATGRHRLSAMYCLERPTGDDEKLSKPQIETLSGHDSLVTALRYLFCLDPNDPGMLVRQFKMLEHLVSQIPIVRLTIPNDYSALPCVHEAVISDLKARSQLGAPAVR